MRARHVTVSRRISKKKITEASLEQLDELESKCRDEFDSFTVEDDLSTGERSMGSLIRSRLKVLVCVWDGLTYRHLKNGMIAMCASIILPR